MCETLKLRKASSSIVITAHVLHFGKVFEIVCLNAIGNCCAKSDGWAVKTLHYIGLTINWIITGLDGYEQLSANDFRRPATCTTPFRPANMQFWHDVGDDWWKAIWIITPWRGQYYNTIQSRTQTGSAIKSVELTLQLNRAQPDCSPIGFYWISNKQDWGARGSRNYCSTKSNMLRMLHAEPTKRCQKEYSRRGWIEFFSGRATRPPLLSTSYDFDGIYR